MHQNKILPFFVAPGRMNLKNEQPTKGDRRLEQYDEEMLGALK